MLKLFFQCLVEYFSWHFQSDFVLRNIYCAHSQLDSTRLFHSAHHILNILHATHSLVFIVLPKTTGARSSWRCQLHCLSKHWKSFKIPRDSTPKAKDIFLTLVFKSIRAVSWNFLLYLENTRVLHLPETDIWQSRMAPVTSELLGVSDLCVDRSVCCLYNWWRCLTGISIHNCIVCRDSPYLNSPPSYLHI
jgi:hypothetical protein